MDDELIKKSKIRKRQEQLAIEAALKGLGSEYSDFERLINQENFLKKELEKTPEDESLEATEVMRIPYRNPVALETSRQKKNPDDSRLIEKIRGETITQARKPEFPQSAQSRADEIFAEARSRFGGTKDLIDKNKKEESDIVSREPATSVDKDLKYKTIQADEYEKFSPEIQNIINKTHTYDESSGTYNPKQIGF